MVSGFLTVVRAMTPSEADRARGALVGLAVGDAVGTTVEFRPRDSFEPLTDMVGGGPFALRPGEWTDDTSMALCLGASLLHRGQFDARDQMNRYCNWQAHGYMSSNGRCFDIGNTVAAALQRYREIGEPFAGATDPQTAGNGSLMRLAPVVLFYFPDVRQIDHYAGESSRTTHGAAEAVEACRIFTAILTGALSAKGKSELLRVDPPERASPPLRAIAAAEYLDKSPAQIRGLGYAVASLEAALWCFAQSEDFAQAILLAANLGEDADTTAAICGQLAGAHYGYSGIPEAWRSKLVMHDELAAMADGLFNAIPGSIG